MILPVDKIIKLRMDGVGTTEIAKRLKLTRKQVDRKLWKLTTQGVKFPRIALPILKRSLINSIVKDYKKGTRMKDLAAKYGRSHQRIYEIIKREGVFIPSPSEAGKLRRKKTCKRGHDITGKNWGWTPGGRFKCLQCERERKLRQHIRQRICPKGHRKTGKNIYMNGGYKRCRKCQNELTLRRYHERKK